MRAVALLENMTRFLLGFRFHGHLSEVHSAGWWEQVRHKCLKLLLTLVQASLHRGEAEAIVLATEVRMGRDW